MVYLIEHYDHCTSLILWYCEFYDSKVLVFVLVNHYASLATVYILANSGYVKELNVVFK